MPEKIQFDSPWNVATIEATLNDVSDAKGTSESLTAKIGTLANADMSNVNLATYTTPSLHDNTEGKVTIQSGGYLLMGNICVINVRIKTTAQLLGSGIFKGLPKPVAAADSESFPFNSSAVAVTNQKGYGITITKSQDMIFASSSLPIAADTVICMSAIYPCVVS